jgi:branched-chain amino acid transport system substrate-binding protein
MLTRRQLTLTGAAFAVTATSARAQTAQGEPLLIGVPVPLSGVLAQGGQVILAGVQYAADLANKRSGVMGRPIKLLIEDTKSEPNTAATVASKMASEDKVYAFVGGYGSTADFAMLQSLRRYKTIFIHTASSSVRLEQAFGKEPWYHHVYIWDYHRQIAAVSFFNAINPKPKTVALAYEDGLYGSDAAKYAEQYIKAGGFEIVMKEPFKSGSPDFSPILTRVKSLNPDVFFSIGYSGDNVQLIRQEASLGIRPKLSVVVTAGDKRSDYGDFGENTAVIAEWSAEAKVPGNEAFVKQVLADTKMTTIAPPFLQGFVGMNSLISSIEVAKSFDAAAVMKALDETTFETPYGKLKYQPSEGGALHQLLSNENMVLIQFRKDGEQVVLPAEKANGSLVYPAK